MNKSEWLEDCVPVCLGRHLADQVRIVYYQGGSYSKMCRACYEKYYPQYRWEDLEIA